VGRSRYSTVCRRTAAALALALAVAGSPSLALAQQVEVLLADSSPAYRELADALIGELGPRLTIEVTSLGAAARDPSRRTEAAVTIAVGTRALASALEHPGSAPIIATLLPRSAFERLARSPPRADARPLTAVFLDQPFSRQLNLIRLVAPGRNRVGVLTSPESDASVGVLTTAARGLKFAIANERVASAAQLYSSLARLLTDTDVLLALPDPVVFNSGTIQNILLTTYRAQQPLFGFSHAYVRAGAIAAVYSTPRQLAAQTAEAASRALTGAALSRPSYPKAFSVAVNATVARSLGLAVEDEAALVMRLQRMEREP
jgi:putative ABC transport system substrate-binding protein